MWFRSVKFVRPFCNGIITFFVIYKIRTKVVKKVKRIVDAILRNREMLCDFSVHDSVRSKTEDCSDFCLNWISNHCFFVTIIGVISHCGTDSIPLRISEQLFVDSSGGCLRIEHCCFVHDYIIARIGGNLNRPCATLPTGFYTSLSSNKCG